MASHPYPMASRGFWRCYFITLRPYLLFVSAAAGLVGLALPERRGSAVYVAALIAFFLSYGLGQALTDVFQLDTDALSSPYRPLVQGRIRRRDVLVVSLMGLGVCSLIFVACSGWTLVLCALAVLGLFAYTPCKRWWWAGPLWNAGIVALLPAIGFVCVARTADASLHSAPLRAAMSSVFASYAVFVLLGYFKDISADRATGYETLPVKCGRSASVGVSFGLAAAAVLASAHLMSLAGLPGRQLAPSTVLAVGMWLAGALCLAAAHGLMLATEREAQAHGPIAWSVRGFLLLHLGEAAAFQPVLAWPAVAGFVLFEIALAVRPERSQI